MGLRESYDFVHFKGRATAAGLFITLYENSDKIIVLDDCDSVFKDDDAVNILKGALDSYDTRKISYITTKALKMSSEAKYLATLSLRDASSLSATSTNQN